MASEHERRIQQRAYELWQAEGQPDGREAHHWSQAEAEFAEAQGKGTSDGARTAARGTGEDKPRKPRKAPTAKETIASAAAPVARATPSRKKSPKT